MPSISRRRGTVITIANWAGVNSGDDAIFSALLTALRNSIPGELRIYSLADNEGEVARKYDVDGTAPLFEYYRPSVLPRVLRYLRESDLVIYGGGDLLNGDLTSLSFLRMAKMLGVPVMCCGVGAIPIDGAISRGLARDTLGAVDLITVRDKDSFSRLEELGVRGVPVKQTADLAFLLLPKLRGDHLVTLKGGNGASRTVGINVRAQDPMYDFYSHWEDERFVEIIADTCDSLIDGLDAHILFLPMEVCGRRKEYHHHVFDDVLARRIRDRVGRPDRFSILEEEYAPDELKGLLGHLDLLVAMRLHTLLIASDQGIPMVAFDYAPKIRSFMASIGREEYLIPAGEWEQQLIMEVVGKALADGSWKDHKRVEELTLLSQENIRSVLGLLQEGRKSRARYFAFLPLVPAFSAFNYLMGVSGKLRLSVRDKSRLKP